MCILCSMSIWWYFLCHSVCSTHLSTYGVRSFGTSKHARNDKSKCWPRLIFAQINVHVYSVKCRKIDDASASNDNVKSSLRFNVHIFIIDEWTNLIHAGHFSSSSGGSSMHAVSQPLMTCIRQMSLMRRLFHSPMFIALLVWFHFFPPSISTSSACLSLLPPNSVWCICHCGLKWETPDQTDVIQYNILIVYGRNYRHQETFIKSCLTYFRDGCSFSSWWLDASGTHISRT